MRYLILVLITISFISCNPKSTSQVSNSDVQYKYSLSLKALNLSEDVSILSTQNDELIFLIYTDIDRDFPSLITQNEFVLDTSNRNHNIPFETKIDSKKEIIIVLLEIDTEETLKEIEPVISQNLKMLYEAQSLEERSITREILGDNDLLLFEKTDLKSLKSEALRIQGINLFDAFDYIISLK